MNLAKTSVAYDPHKTSRLRVENELNSSCVRLITINDEMIVTQVELSYVALS